GRIHFATPMLWSLGFLVTFVIGGMTGVMLAVPPADFMLHNSLFLVAHFHNVIIGGVLFAGFAGVTYWFPKAFGFRLHEGQGGVLVVDAWVLRRVRAPLCRWPPGHDTALAALRRGALAPLGAGGGNWNRDHGLRRRLPGDAVRRQHPTAP